MIYRFIALNGELRGERVTIPATPLTIGRGETCDLRLKDPEVALVHAVVSIKDERLHIGDKGSMNRILVNHRELRESFLKHGDMIELGQTRFLVQAYVQADVKDAESTEPVRSNKKWLLVLLVLLGVGVLVWAMTRQHSTPPPPLDLSVDLDPVTTPDNPDVTTTTIAALPIIDVIDGTPDAAPLMTSNDAPIVPPTPLSDPGDDWALGVQTGTVVDVVTPPPTNTTLPIIEITNMEPTHVEPVIVDPPVVVHKETVEDKAAAMLADAKAKIKTGNNADADELLVAIVRMLPSYVPAYVEMAKRFQEQGVLDMALHQWDEVARLSPGTEAAKQATDAKKILIRARFHATPPFSTWIKVISTEISKFPESPESREMRLLTINLTSGKATSLLDPSAVSVEVKFFDQHIDSGAVLATQAKTPQEPIPVSGLWHIGEPKTVTAAYVIPMSQPAKRNYRYYGYEVRVYYQGALQTIVTEPSDLTDRLRSATMAGSRSH